MKTNKNLPQLDRIFDPVLGKSIAKIGKPSGKSAYSWFYLQMYIKGGGGLSVVIFDMYEMITDIFLN